MNNQPQIASEPPARIYAQSASTLDTIGPVSLIGIRQPGMIGMGTAPDVHGALLIAMAQLNIPTLLITQATSDGGFCVVVAQQDSRRVADTFGSLLSDAFQGFTLYAIENLVMISLKADSTSTLACLLDALAALPLVAISASGRNLSVVVATEAENSAKAAIRNSLRALTQ